MICVARLACTSLCLFEELWKLGQSCDPPCPLQTPKSPNFKKSQKSVRQRLKKGGAGRKRVPSLQWLASVTSAESKLGTARPA
eukprot:5854813-Amphidinium_carterae.1